MKTTLNEIRAHNPCVRGWTKLLAYLGKTKSDDEPLDLMTILKSNGIEDAVWALRVFDYKEHCLFDADVAESVLHIFEDKYPEDNRARKAIEAIRQYKAGQITKGDLRAAAYDSAYAVDVASYTTAYAAANAVDVASYAAHVDGDDASFAAANAAANAAKAAYIDAYVARQAKWEEIKQLFIKHFK